MIELRPAERVGIDLGEPIEDRVGCRFVQPTIDTPGVRKERREVAAQGFRGLRDRLRKERRFQLMVRVVGIDDRTLANEQSGSRGATAYEVLAPRRPSSSETSPGVRRSGRGPDRVVCTPTLFILSRLDKAPWPGSSLTVQPHLPAAPLIRFSQACCLETSIPLSVS